MDLNSDCNSAVETYSEIQREKVMVIPKVTDLHSEIRKAILMVKRLDWHSEILMHSD